MRNKLLRYLLSGAFLLLFSSFLWAQSSNSRVEFHKMPCTKLQGVSERDYTVYLPPSYDNTKSCKYPVLYLLHGGNCSNRDWVTYGNLQAVTDSLIRIGMAKEMVIVCAEGNQNYMIWFDAPHWQYEDFFFNEFIPYIENKYRIIGDKRNRAVAGYSMGGGGAVVYGVHFPEKFNSICGMSSYLRSQHLEGLKNDPTSNERQRIVDDNNPIIRIERADNVDIERWKKVNWFIDCGDSDFTYDPNMNLISAFHSRGIPYRLYVEEGGHDWKYWERSLKRVICFVSEKIM